MRSRIAAAAVLLVTLSWHLPSIFLQELMTATVAAVRTTCFSLYIRRLPLWCRLMRGGSSSGSFRFALPSRTHPVSRFGSAAEAVQPKEIIDRALSSPLAQAKSKHPPASAFGPLRAAELVCCGHPPIQRPWVARVFKASNACGSSSRASARRGHMPLEEPAVRSFLPARK